MLYPTSGSRLFIADAPTGRDGAIPASGWVEIGETEALGLLGIEWLTDEAEIAEDIDPTAALVNWTAKRARRAKPMQVVMGNDPTDPGQIILTQAAQSMDHYPFRIDFPNGGPSRQWLAQVVSLADAFDAANGVVRLQAELLPSTSTGIQRSEDT
ncbi:hypothetical protein PAF17_18935 [Paracoccus sp. Z330]|uniref:Phage tail protein n=1 Tax=Paracoccus onchidii TaxID=3017813 RepID=A0ABT4ZLE0_9RHOB|nr:hypothetical protein [Paracoccus onchidii]MDB6179550.1 hypothetical protein [Paracoccus onchidii]